MRCQRGSGSGIERVQFAVTTTEEREREKGGRGETCMRKYMKNSDFISLEHRINLSERQLMVLSVLIISES